MRVAFVLGTTSGGTGRHVLMLAEGLVRRGHQVLVLGPRSVEERFSFAGAGARFVEVPVSVRPHPVKDLRAVLAIRRLTKDAEVVHAHGLRAGALAVLGGGRVGALLRGLRRPGAAAGVAARVAAPGATARGRLVVTLHNALTAGGLIGVIYGVLERIVARGADHVLVVSPDLGERMSALGARDVRPAVVPAPRLRPAKRTPEEVRAELGAGRRPIVLTLARLAQQKGLEGLLDVARGPWSDKGSGSAQVSTDALGDTVPAAEVRDGAAAAAGAAGVREAWVGDGDVVPLFVVAGEGPLLDELRDRVDAERLPVIFLGSRDDVPDLLAAATAVLWASRWEGQPLSLSEALMAGRPVIATAVGGIPELLGGAGMLVPYGDTAAMRNAVREVIGDEAMAARMAAAAALRGARLPDADDAIASVAGVYGASRSRE